MKSTIFKYPVISIILLNSMVIFLGIFMIKQNYYKSILLLIPVNGILNKWIWDNAVDMNKNKKIFIIVSLMVMLIISIFYIYYYFKGILVIK